MSRGQRNRSPRSRAERPQSVRAFLWDAVRTVATADGRTARSFRDVVRHPGLLTRAYFDERPKYINPVELFLLANLFFFVIGGFTRSQMLTTSLQSQLCCQAHSPVARRMFNAHVGEMRRASWNDARRDPKTEQVPDATWKVWTVPPAERSTLYMKYRLTLQYAIAKFETRFNDVSDQSARTLVILMVPLFALLVALLEFRRGSGVQHIVFSLYFYSFAMVLYMASGILNLVAGVLWKQVTHHYLPDAADLVFGVTVITVQSAYLVRAFSVAYGDGRLASVVRGIVAGYAGFRIIMLYRLVLFIVAYYSAR